MGSSSAKYLADLYFLTSKNPVYDVPKYNNVFSLSQIQKKIFIIGGNVSLISGHQFSRTFFSNFALIVSLDKESVFYCFYNQRFS